MAGRRRNRIESTGREGMTAQQTANCKATAAPWAVRGDGNSCIFRAGGNELAAARTHRVQCRRDPPGVESDECEQNVRHDAGFAAESGAGTGSFTMRAASVEISSWAC